MPFWRTTKNIFSDLGEHFDPNWMDSDKLITPPNKPWDYKRDMQIEDVNLWEEIRFNPRGIGVWAAWDPYAEFYMITNGKSAIETFYGPGASRAVYKRAKELGVNLLINTHWVEDDEMWLHQNPENNKNIII